MGHAAPAADISPRSQIVLADADDALRRALTFALELEGYDVATCRDGESLVALDLPSQAACLVIEQRLQRMSGLDALEALRARGVTLPAILLTSYADPQTRRRSRQARAWLVEKPLLAFAKRRFGIRHIATVTVP